MLEIPEAIVFSSQLEASIRGKSIVAVKANQSPHKFAWYFEDPKKYPSRLVGKMIASVHPTGGMVMISATGTMIVFSDGAGIRFFEKDADLPKKHQLLVNFDDGSVLAVTIRMYGGIFVFPRGTFDNPYYLGARDKPSPLQAAFNRDYFDKLRQADGINSLSVKAFLATDQRIPGLGNGTLQDILFNAGIHPKRKMASLSVKDLDLLFRSIKRTLQEMADQGGRDTEKDLYGNPGGYATKCSRLTVGKPCPICGSAIEKGNFLGGSIYYCPQCQPI